MNFTEIIKHKSLDFEHQTFSCSKENISSIKDKYYIQFMKETNGGYFYNNSLIIFGILNKNNIQSSFNNMNNILKESYKEITSELCFFGQDIFGNAFAFRNTEIVFFNLESGDLEVLAKGFQEWLNVLYNDLDYYTGESLTYDLTEYQQKELVNNKRLCPKYPFILGGDFLIENLTLKNYIDNISFSSDIANQIRHLPDGSKVKITFNR